MVRAAPYAAAMNPKLVAVGAELDRKVPGDAWPLCSGPGRKGQPQCQNPVSQRSSTLCRSHVLQIEKRGVLSPLRTRTSTAPCVGPAAHGEACGRQVYFREPGQDDGICKSHYDQMKRRGSMSAISPKPAPVLKVQCPGPGRNGMMRCERMADNGIGYCDPHMRQLRKNQTLKPVRQVNTPDGPCLAPGEGEALCGRPMLNKAMKLCGGHYAQVRREQALVPLKSARRRGVSTPCKFPACRYLDAPDAEGYCRHHWRQFTLGQRLVPLRGNSNRGRQVLLRDEDGNKLCPQCDVWKAESEFTKTTGASDGFNYRCRRCTASAQRLAKYGIDIDGYEALLHAQGGRCAICPTTARGDGARLSIDHDHACCPGSVSCGKCIRGLLCPDCNRGLGLFRDNPRRLRAAAAYLKSGAASKVSPITTGSVYRLKTI